MNFNRGITAGESSDLTTTFSLFKSYLDKQLIGLKDDLKKEAQNSTAQAAKKLKEEAKFFPEIGEAKFFLSKPTLSLLRMC